MGQSSDVFGFLRIGASINEKSQVRKCLDFNKQVLAAADDTGFWTYREFRFADDLEDVRSAQMIGVVKFYTRITIDEFQMKMVDFFSKLAWSDAYIVNRSVDRPLLGEPMVYEFAMENSAFTENPVGSVGEFLNIKKIVRSE